MELCYLNHIIIQSENCISVDQTDHILDLIETHLKVPQQIKATNTALHNDRQFNDKVQLSLPTSPE